MTNVYSLRKTLVVAALALFALAPALLHAAPPLPGAIFTTTADGTIVNGNTQYQSKCEVYLDGGPGPNAPAGAAGLPAGDYYFQVTDPSGKKLLSTDPVSNRRFTVSSAGVITAYTGSGGPVHPTGIDQDHPELGAITIQLANNTCPADFLDTPNNGGVYKAWITPVGDGTLAGGGFVGDPSKVDNGYSPGYFHGFIPARSKTDNFKVKAKEATFCLTLRKEIVDTKGAVSPGLQWQFFVTDPLSVVNEYFADTKDGSVTVCDLTSGTYTVEESLTDSAGTTYSVVGLTVNGVAQSPSSVFTFNWTPGKPNPFVIVFRNTVAK
jgi:hypothetical protein